MSDDGSCGNRHSAERRNGQFGYMIDDWGIDLNFLIEADICIEDHSPGPCGPGSDWPTAGGNFRRTSATNSSTGDARCKQTLLWTATDPSGFIYSRPVIYDNVLIVTYNDFLRGFDIASGTTLWTLSGFPEVGSGLSSVVTAYDGYVYFGGGSAHSFSRADLYTGVIDWSRNALGEQLIGNTTNATSVILDIEGTEVIFFGTTDGALYALDISTGLNFTGWPVNPIMTDGHIAHSLSSDGSNRLFIGTDGSYGTGHGSLFALDAANGAILWSLGEGDFYGSELSEENDSITNVEIFSGPIGYDLYNDQLFVMSSLQGEIVGPPSGVRYSIAASDGSIVWAEPGRYSSFSGPVIGMGNLVYFTALQGWTSEPAKTDAVFKTSGSIYWQSEDCFNALNWIEGVVDCQPYSPNLLYMGNTDAQFIILNTKDGTTEFEYNYIAHTSNRGVGTAIDSDHVVFANRQGDIFVFGIGVERPRLRILCNGCDRYEAVPFFSSPNYIVTYEDVFMNNGCADLVFSLSVDEGAPASVTSVHPGRIDRMSKIADRISKNDYPSLVAKLTHMTRVDGDELDPEFLNSAYSKDSYSSKAAYNPPAWLNNIVVSSGVLAPRETFDIQFNVNSQLVPRGPHQAYVTISTNDQYYLNSNIDPVCQLGVLGGCLQAEDVLIFGNSEQNRAPVLNTGEMGNQNSYNLFEFDGDFSMYWQGGSFSQPPRPELMISVRLSGWPGQPIRGIIPTRRISGTPFYPTRISAVNASHTLPSIRSCWGAYRMMGERRMTTFLAMARLIVTSIRPSILIVTEPVGTGTMSHAISIIR